MRERCPWCGTDPLYVAYHDEEWGVSVHDDRQLFELLILEGAQAGLSWITVLRKRDAYRQAFEGFTVDDELMALADPLAVFMHCLPAYRGFEVTASVIDGPRSVVFQQGHNRLHASRGLLAFLMGVR